MDNELEFLINETLKDTRLDKAVVSLCPNLSRSKIQELIDDGDILVNYESSKSSYKLREGDKVTVIIPEEEEKYDAEPENIPLDIVYEDDDLMIINKPQGMVVHPAPGHYNGTIVNAILYHVANIAKIGENYRPGIVHRIDKDTSGLLMVAKSELAFKSLSAQLKDKTAYRRYVALVNGEIPFNEGVVKAPIGRSSKNRKEMAVVSTGKPAVTHIKVLERFHGFTLIECLLETGRTHQIRVHLSYIKYPIVGDQVYGFHKNYGFDGQLLHAATLSLIHPRSNKRLTVDAPLPDYFSKALDQLRETGIIAEEK